MRKRASIHLFLFVADLQGLPPSQRAATFSIDQAMEKMRQGIGGQ
jgi:hypothetical protein